MGRLPRLVATDIDGTLIHRDRTLTRRTADTLARLVDAGTHVVLVTGRPVRWLAVVYDQLAAPIPSVCANGAVVYDPVADAVLRTDPLTPQLLAEVARRLRAEVPGAVFAVEVEDGRSMRHDPGWPVRAEEDDHPSVRPFDSPADLFAAPASKLLVRSTERDSDVFVKLVAGAVAGLAEATHSSYSGLVEISAAGVTKAAGLAWLCSRYGVDSSAVLAFGDMPNDIPLLTWAGRSVAVANAHPSVLEIADERTASNDEDGVAAYLDALFER
ncbi:haloacid dehalogenase [Plantactinospora sp. KBS50]|nr:HAD family hydrolase [Plantactinospora sp. KBS50]ASW57257.1 haloacid dehalogenase [Plantactinospora sp. KBS50]